MALSEQEQRLLDEMERNLYANEADVVSTTPNESIEVSAKTVVNTILAVAVGLGVVLVGLILAQPLIGIAGFALLIGGIYWAFSNTSASAPDAGESGKAPKRGGSAPSGNQKSRKSFMEHMESRWNRRQDGAR